MMDSNTAFEQRQHHCNLWKLLVFCAQSLDRVVVDLADGFPFIFSVKVAIFEGHRELLTLTFTEREHDTGIETFRNNEGD